MFVLKVSFRATMGWCCAGRLPKFSVGLSTLRAPHRSLPGCFCWALLNHFFLKMMKFKFPTYNFTFSWSPVDIFRAWFGRENIREPQELPGLSQASLLVVQLGLSSSPRCISLLEIVVVVRWG